MKLKTTFFQKVFLILLGIFFSFFLLEAGLRLGSFTLLSVQEHSNRVSIKKGGAYRILCLGESTTQGEWPPFLEAALNRSGAGRQFTVIDKAGGGRDTGTILNQVEFYLDKYHPDMVVTMMGVNDPGAAHLPIETPPASKPASFVKLFKTYKLARLLFHMAFKTNRWALPPENTQAQLTTRPALPATGPDTENAEPVKKLKKELELNPGNDETYLQLGTLYREQAEFQQAEMYIKKALKINPRNIRGHLELGRLYQDHQWKFQQAEEEFKKALKLNPGNYEAYHKLGRLYLDQGKLQQAEMYIKKALQINPGNDLAYIQLGEIHRGQGKLQQAEEVFKKALKISPGNDRAYYQLGELYREQGKLQQAEEEFKKALKLNPGNQRKYQQAEIYIKKTLQINPRDDGAYLQLGGTSWEQGEFQQAEMYIKKALQINPRNDRTCLALGWMYRKQGRFQQAEMYIKKALQINPVNDDAYHELSWLYQEQGKFQQAEEVFKKALKLNPGNSRAYYGIEGIYWKRGRFRQAEEPYHPKATLEYTPFTTNNYHALKTILDKRKIRLVCVQYPMRNLAPLKNIFAEQADDIVFVDNEKIFREAVKKDGYAAYFRDIFAGDFGHCTDNGNKLLGENIAGVILREVFHKKFQRNKAGAGSICHIFADDVFSAETFRPAYKLTAGDTGLFYRKRKCNSKGAFESGKIFLG